MNEANFLKKIRIQMCLTQKEFANIIGISQGLLALYERGKHTPGCKNTRTIVNNLQNKGIKIEYTDLRV